MNTLYNRDELSRANQVTRGLITLNADLTHFDLKVPRNGEKAYTPYSDYSPGDAQCVVGDVLVSSRSIHHDQGRGLQSHARVTCILNGLTIYQHDIDAAATSFQTLIAFLSRSVTPDHLAELGVDYQREIKECIESTFTNLGSLLLNYAVLNSSCFVEGFAMNANGLADKESRQIAVMQGGKVSMLHTGIDDLEFGDHVYAWVPLKSDEFFEQGFKIPIKSIKSRTRRNLVTMSQNSIMKLIRAIVEDHDLIALDTDKEKDKFESQMAELESRLPLFFKFCYLGKVCSSKVRPGMRMVVIRRV